MLTALFQQDCTRFRIDITGHAEYNPGGPDIVCASTSTLAYTLLQCLIAEQDAGNMSVFKYRVDKGDVHIKFTPRKETAEYMEVIVAVIVSGFAMLQKKYPEHVKVEHHKKGVSNDEQQRSN